MEKYEAAAAAISRVLDFLAGVLLVLTAALVVSNILGRALLARPILGTYEMVGFLTAGVVGLALARCAQENSHIVVTFLLERLPAPLRRGFEIAFALPALAFLLIVTGHLVAYGSRIAASGVVSPTTQIVFYPFIYLLALGFAALFLVELFKLPRLLAGGERFEP